MTARRPQGTVARRLARAMANLVYRDIDVHLPAAAVVACTLVWPAIILYWMTRPVPGRAVAARRRTDARAQLVAAALAHEAGRIDDAELAREVAALRQS